MLAPVEIAGGQVSTADEMSAATSVLRNWQMDVAGVNRMRPALVTYSTTGLGSAALIGLYRWKTYVVGVDSARKIYALSDGAPTVWVSLSDATSATKLDGSLTPVFAEDASDLFIVGGGAIQKWNGAGLTARLGGTSPTDVTHLINVAQRLIANTQANPSRVLWSDLGDGVDSTWGALSFANAEARPDVLVAIGETTAELVLWGKTTTEIWGVSVDPLTPYQRIVTLNIGMGAPYSSIRADVGGADCYFWLDNKRRFLKSVGNREYAVISDAIAKDLKSLVTITDCRGYCEDTALGTVLTWIFPTDGRTFTCDLAGTKWQERNYYTAPTNGAFPVSCHAYWDTLNLNLVGASTGAAVYKMDTTVRQDIGGTMVAERITGWQDFGTQNFKRSACVRVIMRRGTATLGGTDGQLEVAVAHDGGGWSNFKTLTTGQPSDQLMVRDLYFGGCFYKRRYWIRYSGTDDMSLVGVYDDVEDLEAAGG
jgi:hypothetical protein